MKKTLIITVAVLLSIAFILYIVEVIIGCKSIDSDCVLALATILLILVGYSQLEKLNTYNNMQALFESEREWKTDEFKKKRKNMVSLLKPFLEYPTKLDDLPKDEWNKIMTTAEDVFDYFDVVSYYALSKKMYTIDDIYECYGYFIKYYWLLCSETNYISNVKERTGKQDMYPNFKVMFDTLMKVEKKKFKKESVQKVIHEAKSRLVDFIHEEENLKLWNG
ncbi:MAG: hypothetical protein ABSF79_12980 [Smithellaceae bacterium]|jgi:hypothetical protein